MVIDVETQEDDVLAKIVVCGIHVMALTYRSFGVHASTFYARDCSENIAILIA